MLIQLFVGKLSPTERQPTARCDTDRRNRHQQEMSGMDGEADLALTCV
jgi:hypothetical protein